MDKLTQILTQRETDPAIIARLNDLVKRIGPVEKPFVQAPKQWLPLTTAKRHDHAHAAA